MFGEKEWLCMAAEEDYTALVEAQLFQVVT
jgi:hypothetical protein